MAFPIFIDANIPMYAGGQLHPLKRPCAEILVLIGEEQARFSTDAEILQEIIHRYMAIGAWVTRGSLIFEEFSAIMSGRVEPMTVNDVNHAAGLAGVYTGLSARDLIHIAIMDRIGSDTIVSADQSFDQVTALRRLDPIDFATWRREVVG